LNADIPAREHFPRRGVSPGPARIGVHRLHIATHPTTDWYLTGDNCVMTDKNDEKKIIIDEDWKSKVEREREQDRHKPEEKPAAAPDQEMQQAGMTLFDYLVSTLAAQTMMALGLVAEEGQTQVMVDLGAARHMIDSLMMLREKTKGNLTTDEEANLSEAISELQRVFAVRATQVREAQLKNPPIDPNPPFLGKK